MTRFKRFSEIDHDFIRQNFMSMTNKEIGTHLGRSESSIAFQLSQMKISRGLNRWSSTELETLRSLAAIKSIKQISAQLGIKESRVKGALSRYHILTGRTGRFEKGHIPWIKGTKGVIKSTPGMKRTQFKTGALPHNTLYDGKITVRKDKTGRLYKWIRLSIRKWEPLHRYNYRNAFGEVPAGFIVAFKDNDAMNCEVDNLVLITRAKNMQQNTIHRYPPELVGALQILGKFKKKLKSYEK